MKPTERQFYLMSFADKRLWRMSSYGNSHSLIRPYVYQNPNRLPSQREATRMIALGWIRYEIDPSHTTTNTKTGKKWSGFRVVLTHEGFVAFNAMRLEHEKIAALDARIRHSAKVHAAGVRRRRRVRERGYA